MDEDLVSPGLDNEAITKTVLERDGLEQVTKLGSGAYASVWLCRDSSGELVVAKATTHEERQEGANIEHIMLRVLGGETHIP